MSQAQLLALAGGAGLAGGFNTPLLGVVFVVEEFLGSFSPQLIWPALLVGAAAAAVSSLGGQPEFALGVMGAQPPELQQLLWAVPIGLVGGLLGGVSPGCCWPSAAAAGNGPGASPCGWGWRWAVCWRCFCCSVVGPAAAMVNC